MTQGSKSTEFWLAVVSIVVGAWLASRGTTVDVMVSVLAPATVYIGSRGYVKGKANGKGQAK